MSDSTVIGPVNESGETLLKRWISSSERLQKRDAIEDGVTDLCIA
jgi:hypothetical protein